MQFICTLLLPLLLVVPVFSSVTVEGVSADLKQDYEAKLAVRYPNLAKESLVIEFENLDRFQGQLPQDASSYEFEYTDQQKMLGRQFVRVKLFNSETTFLKQYTLYLKVEAKGYFLKAARKIYPNESLKEEDVTIEVVDLKNRPKESLTQLSEVLGKEAKFTLQKDGFLVRWMVRDKPLIYQGQTVELKLQSGMITVLTKGFALDDGKIGEVIRVRAEKSNKIVKAKIIGENHVQITDVI